MRRILDWITWFYVNIFFVKIFDRKHDWILYLCFGISLIGIYVLFSRIQETEEIKHQLAAVFACGWFARNCGVLIKECTEGGK